MLRPMLKKTLLGLSVALLAAPLVGTVQAAISAPGVQVPAHQSVTLPNGMKLILAPRHELPLIAFTATLRGGATLDPAAHQGVAALTADLLTRGAGSRDAYAFADAVEGAGASLDADARAEAISVRGQFLARDRALMVELLADVLMRPRFDNDELEKLRSRRIEMIKAAKDSSPQSLLGSYGRALLFAGYPYANPSGGSEAGLATVDRAAVLDFYQQQFGADRTTLTLVGDFDPAQMQKDIKRAFGGWQKAGAKSVALAPTPRIQGRTVLLVDAPGSAQTYFWMANVGVPRRYAERAALDVVNTEFGGRFTSMLNTELRIKTGLTYGASSRFARGSVPGEFVISSFTRTDDTERAVDLALATLGKLHQQGISADALGSARSYLVGQYPLGFETNGEWAGALADLDFYSLPTTEISSYVADLGKVDAKAAQAVIADAYADADNLDIVMIGDAAKIRSVAAKYGKLLEKPLTAPDFQPPAR